MISNTITELLLPPKEEEDRMLQTMSFEEVLKEYESILGWHVWRVMQRAPFRDYEYEDLMQVARVATWEAHRKYDPERGARFNTFLTRCLWTALDEEVKRAYRKVATVRDSETRPLESYPDPTLCDALLFDDVRGQLSDTSRHVFNCFIDPPFELQELAQRQHPPAVTQVMVQRHLGMSDSSVVASVREIRRVITTVLAPEE